jgi:hypothetical protein
VGLRPRLAVSMTLPANQSRPPDTSVVPLLLSVCGGAPSHFSTYVPVIPWYRDAVILLIYCCPTAPQAGAREAQSEPPPLDPHDSPDSKDPKLQGATPATDICLRDTEQYMSDCHREHVIA